MAMERAGTPVGDTDDVVSASGGVHLEIENFGVVVQVVVGGYVSKGGPVDIGPAAEEIHGENGQSWHGLLEQFDAIGRQFGHDAGERISNAGKGDVAHECAGF